MKKGITLLIASIITLSFITLVSALPPEPMYFYGKITFTNGTAIPNGYYLVAKINNVISGECGIINGDYGKDANTCIILSRSISASKVEFFLGETKIGESNFQSKEIMNVNFNIITLPAKLPPLTDGVCKPAECSYNLLDCDASKTDICSGNGRCDAEIGETCKSNPQDCGICKSDDGSGSSSSGSGSKGGSSSNGKTSSSGSTSNVIKLSPENTTNQNTNSTNNTSSNVPEETKKTFSIFGITGLAIGEFVKTTTGKGIIIFIVLVAVLIILYIISKNKLKNNRNKPLKADKMFRPSKRNGRASRQKNIKVIKLSEMKKKSP